MLNIKTLSEIVLSEELQITLIFMLRSKIENVHWAEKMTTARSTIREKATTRNVVLWLF
jgi:hypothetical protein